MKLTIILLFAFSALVHAQNVTLGTRIQSRAYTCMAADFGLRCVSCTEGQVCNGVTSLGQIKCDSPNSYCDSATNTCTSVRPTNCTAVTFNFKCHEEGFFPDIENCQVYYFCTGSNAIAETWKCPDNYVYDTLNNNCKRKEVEEDCATMKCVIKSSFIVHSVNPSYYAYCDMDLVATHFKCPTNKKFNMDSGCRYVCNAEGYYPGSKATEYYHCERNWVVTESNCATGYTFNATSKNCVENFV